MPVSRSLSFIIAEALHFIAGAAFLQQRIAVVGEEHTFHHIRVGAAHF